MSKKILYLMHVEWEWTKQRPQFIAEELSKFYEVHVFFPVSYFTKFKRLMSPNKKVPNLFLHLIPYLPLYTRIRQVYDLNKFIWRLYFRYIIKYNFDYMWVTYPALYDYISPNNELKIIYDCMDDTLAFDSRFYFKDKLLNSEKELIKKASVIFVSSNSLADKLNQREECKDKLILNRNAFDGKIFDIKDNHFKEEKDIYKICYVGSISSWFDFESLYYTLENHKNIEYHLIGPADNVPKHHKRIKLYGHVMHDELYSHVKDMDCFIMPFKLNDLILSVDPVKLNEYINYNKPIISIYYDEIKRFSPFVSFYHNKEDLNEILKYMVKNSFPKKYSDEQRIEFLKHNTWKERINTIIDNLD